MTQFYTPLPSGVSPEWLTPELAHSDDVPFCAKPDCRCHYQPERVEQYMVGPVSRGEISGQAGLDRYYCRQPAFAGGRK